MGQIGSSSYDSEIGRLRIADCICRSKGCKGACACSGKGTAAG